MKWLVGYREISEKHLRFCGGPVQFMSSNVAISRVSIWERYLLSSLGISPLATNNHTKVQRIILKDYLEKRNLWNSGVDVRS